MTDLAGQVAVVTGASKGIGAAIALALAEAGAAVAVNYTSSRTGAEAVVAQIAAAGGRAIAVPADITQDAARAAMFADVAAQLGPIDILVNNAGIFRYFPLAETTAAELAGMFATNVFALLLAIRDVVPHMPARGGSIINISSVASTVAPPQGTVYAASKAAVDSITRSLARELGPRGIRVNAIRPGAVETEGVRDGGLLDDARRQAFIATTPLGRIGLPQDIAPAAVFLASDAAGWITGETLLVAGGRG